MWWAFEIWTRKTREALFIGELGKRLYVWITAISIGVIHDPLTAGRIVSAVSGTVSILGVFLLANRLYGSSILSVLSAVVYALLPLATFHNRLALVDSTLAALLVWSLLASVDASLAHSPRRQNGMALISGLLLGAATWTKLSAIVFAYFPAISFLLLLRGNPRIMITSLIWCYIPFGFVACGAVFAPTRDYATNPATFLLPFSAQNIGPFEMWAMNTQKTWEWVRSLVTWPAMFAMLAAGFLRRDRSILLLAYCTVLPITLFALTGERIYSRYILPCAAPISILVAIGILCITQLISKGIKTIVMLRGALIIISTVCVVWPSVIFSMTLVSDPASLPLAHDDRDQYFTGWASGFGFPEVFSIVESTSASLNRPVILLTNPRMLSFTRYRFPNDSRIHVREELAVYWGIRSIVQDWKVHKVMTFVLTVEPFDNWQRFEMNNPEFKLWGAFAKPNGTIALRLYGADFGVID